jgi:hypothetical protein
MKRIMLAIVLFWCGWASAQSCVVTAYNTCSPNAGLTIPLANQPNWGTNLNLTINRIDQIFGGTITVPAFSVTSATISSGSITNTPIGLGGAAAGAFTVVSGTAGVLSSVYNASACGTSTPPSWCAGADLGAWINAAFVAGAKTVTMNDGPVAATTVIAPTSGGVLRFGTGAYTVPGINLPDSTSANVVSATVECSGIDKTTVTLASGSNRDLITNTNFGTLTGTSNYYGAFRPIIRNCTLDGNKANQSTGWIVRLYGRAPVMENLVLQNGKSGGRYTEWDIAGDSTFSGPLDDLEGQFTNVKESFNSGSGVVFKGPHDSKEVSGVSYQNTGWGWDVQSPLHLNGSNAFLNTLGGCWTHSYGSLSGSENACTTGTGTGLLVDNSGGAALFSSSTFAGQIGIELRQPNNIIHGTVANSATGVKFNGGGGSLQLVMFSNTTFFDCTSESGNIILDLYSTDTTGTLKGSGCWTGAEYLRIGGAGSVAGHRFNFQIPGSSIRTQGGFIATFPATSGNVFIEGNNPITFGTATTTSGPHSFGGWNISFPLANGTVALTSNITVTASGPTVGQAACIKAAGPPVVIGYCSTVVGAGGACTCN